MRIAVDAMGGDHAPHEIIKGAVKAAAQLNAEIILVGDQEIIQRELVGYGPLPKPIQIVHASQVVEMNEHAVTAMRKKKDSSIMVANALVAEGKADAVVSCGNTGAQMAAAIFVLGRFDGIDRPAISTSIPTLKGQTVLVDSGANVDVKPSQLVQFALMGSAYCRCALDISNPKVSLLSNGEEETKGNQVVIAAHADLKTTPGIHFVGNVEGRDLFSGKADVVVCDGFVGNTIIKTMEGFVQMMMGRLLIAFGSGVRELLADLDYSNVGGAPLLGVKGVSIVCHGSSRADAVTNGIALSAKCVETRLIDHLKSALERVDNERMV